MQGDERPTFTQEDLAEIDADADAALAEDDAATVDGMRKAGLSDDDITKACGVAPAAPPPTMEEIDAELRELRKMRTEDRQRYWSPQTQAREAELYAAREQLQGESADDGEAAAQGERAGDDLPAQLREAWEADSLGVAGNIKAVQSRVVLALGELPEQEYDGLLSSFDDELSDDERTTIAENLAQDHGNAWKPATDNEVQVFAETEWGAPLMEKWGRQGPKLLGIARKEADGILGRLTATSRLKVERWAAAKSTAQKRAIIEALAARAMRRL